MFIRNYIIQILFSFFKFFKIKKTYLLLYNLVKEVIYFSLLNQTEDYNKVKQDIILGRLCMRSLIYTEDQ